PKALDIIKSIGRESGLLFPGEDGQRMTAQAIRLTENLLADARDKLAFRWLVRTTPFGRNSVAAIQQVDYRWMIELMYYRGFVEDFLYITIQFVAEESLDHHIGLEFLVPTQERHPESTCTQDALRTVLRHRKGREPLAIKLYRFKQFLRACNVMASRER